MPKKQLDVPTFQAPWCSIHQHHKWCGHNGGVLTSQGWQSGQPVGRPPSPSAPLLNWIPQDRHQQQAQLGSPEDGVFFCLTYHATCYRRGPWRLLIEVCGGPNHELWGCLDESDQPMRYFHLEQNAKSEAEAIAKVLLKDRKARK